MPTRLPRLNVTVTDEQHALLLELAKLNGGSAAGYLRQMLDQATPLLRATVPAMRLAAQEMNATREEANQALADMFDALRESAGVEQLDLLSHALGDRAVPSASEGERGVKGGA